MECCPTGRKNHIRHRTSYRQSSRYFGTLDRVSCVQPFQFQHSARQPLTSRHLMNGGNGHREWFWLHLGPAYGCHRVMNIYFLGIHPVLGCPLMTLQLDLSSVFSPVKTTGITSFLYKNYRISLTDIFRHLLVKPMQF